VGRKEYKYGKNVVRAGQAIYIPSNARQWIKNTEKDDLKFLCIVSPSWSEDNEELLPRDKFRKKLDILTHAVVTQRFILFYE
jgi:mannose-6-phosphate isomerase-like protein (cupin superfamily)